MAVPDPQLLAHLEWLGYVRPTGLVVSAAALVRAGAVVVRDGEGGRLLAECLAWPGEVGEGEPMVPDFRAFAERVLGWSFSPKFFVAGEDLPAELASPLPEGGGVLRPDLAVREREPGEGRSPWQLLVRVLGPEVDLDLASREPGQLEVSPHGHLERLLRHTGVRAGLLTNGRVLRLVSAPYGETSGWLDFQVADMAQPAGRPILAALRLLLGEARLLTVPRGQRLTDLLEDSRKYQNEVSERLATQVLHALYELLRGFQAADHAREGELLRRALREEPDEVYRALLTVVLRLVFLLYAEQRDLLPQDETFLRHYSLAGLFARLREDAAQHPDTMDQRYGAWAQLLVLFRMIHDGARSGPLSLPPRLGALFDPDRFPFLEGRPLGSARQRGERLEPPRVPDGTIHRALEKLLVLDGERISYRALDVEQIGSVYETMMGFRLETATGPSVAIKAQKKHGAPTAVDLSELLAVRPGSRDKWLAERTDRKLAPRVKAAVKDAATLEDLHAALLPVIDEAATPDLVPAGALILQPSEERRRSGSHYTPRALTEPIVRRTLEPVLARLAGGEGKSPRPAQILDLAVCDPAMGSGAFLVETCRQLGAALVDAWRVHGGMPPLPADEDDLTLAKRLVAQRCLYGVDRNPVAVDLAKVSLWLATLARDHALTFLKHALRHGDSLVGLSLRQLRAFHWAPDAPGFEQGFEAMRLDAHLARVRQLRGAIRAAGPEADDRELADLWDQATVELNQVRLFGDLAVSAFFDGTTARERERLRQDYAAQVAGGIAERHRQDLQERRHAEPPLAPFHWELEFPEVFERPAPGFDAFVGNPPFAGKNTVAAGNEPAYPDWLKTVNPGSHGNADLVAHFFRRAFTLIRPGGTFGLIATNAIAQGDTRSTGLRWICTQGGELYEAKKRVPWPGQAAVIVSVVHGIKGSFEGPKHLDGREVETITAFLFHSGGHEDPRPLPANAGKSFQGSIVLGMGFTFDDTDTSGVASSLAEMRRLIEKDPRNQEVIFPYIGGEEVNTSPTHAHHRYVINFGDRIEEECRTRWPDLMAIVEEKVKPERMRNNRAVRRRYWWRFGETTPALYSAVGGLNRVLACSLVSNKIIFAFLPTGVVFSHKLGVFAYEIWTAFCTLQSNVHEVWGRFFSSTMKDDVNYSPSDCFETFPFPDGWETSPALEAAGRAYHEHRAALMVARGEGLTTTYNRFHDPEDTDPAIERLRALHLEMDQAVLAAYGWTDLAPAPEFLLEYEIDESTWSPRRRKPYRLRYPTPLHDTLLSRLLELNARRSGTGLVGSSPRPPSTRRRASNRNSPQDSAGDLFH